MSGLWIKYNYKTLLKTPLCAKHLHKKLYKIFNLNFVKYNIYKIIHKNKNT